MIKLTVKQNGITYEQTFTGESLDPVYKYLDNMGKMKEMYIEKIRYESNETLYPDQQKYNHGYDCVNCSSDHLSKMDTHSYICNNCGYTMVEVNNKLILE